MSIRFAIASVLALVMSLPAVAQVQQQDIAGIRNYSRVDATVGCGGSTEPAAMTALKQEGYVSVINLRLPTEEGANVDQGRAAAEQAGLKYIHLPFSGSSPDPRIVESFLKAVADPANQPVFIHCASANRVGAVWMIKRVLQDEWPVERARAEAAAIGLSSPALVTFATDYIASHQ